jgi:hypothetical protein
MLKTATAILTAAAIAALVTLLSAPSGPVGAGPQPQATETALKVCIQHSWPYLNCVGTPLGNQRIRLVTTDNLGS